MNLVRLAKATHPVLLLSLGMITGCPKDHQSGTPAGTAPPIVPQISANALMVLHWYAPIITQYQDYQKNLPLFEKGNEIAGSCDIVHQLGPCSLPCPPPGGISPPANLPALSSIPIHDLSCQTTGSRNAVWTIVSDPFQQVLQSEFTRLNQALPQPQAHLLQGWTAPATNDGTCGANALIWTSIQKANGGGGSVCVTIYSLEEMFVVAANNGGLAGTYGFIAQFVDPLTFQGNPNDVHIPSGTANPDQLREQILLSIQALDAKVWQPFESSVDFVLAYESAHIYDSTDAVKSAADANTLLKQVDGGSDLSVLNSALDGAIAIGNNGWGFEKPGDGPTIRGIF
jgi:hypothetical protein